jgi:hypothetical protein
MSPIVLAFVTAFAVLVLMFKIGIRKFLAHDVLWDLAVSGLLLVCFAGTITGTGAAIVAGAVFSIVLFVLKPLLGTERLTRKGWKRSRPRRGIGPHWNVQRPPWAS